MLRSTGSVPGTGLAVGRTSLMRPIWRPFGTYGGGGDKYQARKCVNIMFVVRLMKRGDGMVTRVGVVKEGPPEEVTFELR